MDEVFYAKRNRPVEGAQWTGIVTSIAIEMLKSGKVEGVVVRVASDPDNAMHPRPILATTVEEILSSMGVKLLVDNLSGARRGGGAGAEEGAVHRRGVRGAGAEVGGEVPRPGEAVRHGDQLHRQRPQGDAVEIFGKRSEDPATVVHYEFMQDYQVHLKHTDGSWRRFRTFAFPRTSSRTSSRPRATRASITSTASPTSWLATWASPTITRT